MPNRDLKESNRRSPSLQLLSDAAERLWYRLITAVDDFGRLEADPEVVFTTCFQRVPKGWTVQKVTQCLVELGTKAPDGDMPLVTLYQVGSRRYLEIVSAKQHIYQRAKQSKYPPVENQHVIPNCTPMHADARTCTQIPSIPESRTPNPDIPNPESRTSVSEDDDARFDEFWQTYPERNGRKVEKAATRALFLKLSHSDQALAVQAARIYANSLKHSSLSAKDPKRFLRDGNGQEPWRDYIPKIQMAPVRREPEPPKVYEPPPPEVREQLKRLGVSIPEMKH